MTNRPFNKPSHSDHKKMIGARKLTPSRPAIALLLTMLLGALFAVSLTSRSGADELAAGAVKVVNAESKIRPAVAKKQSSNELAKRKAAEEKVDFNRDIRPILVAKCYACHGPDEESREADLELHLRDRAVAELDSGTVAIVPGKSDESELIARLLEEDEDLRMPPEEGSALKAEEISLLRRWIDQGAHYAKHWSYVHPVRGAIPEVQNEAWCRTSIDYYVLAKLEAAELSPETEAERTNLIRRLSLDLIGLPPTIEEVNAFIYDNRDDAYERIVDRLLASPRYGEHWARKWLDMARYADSQGYAQDGFRTIWPYRDWVIGALNRDLPFDQFTIEQIAGDMLPDPTTDQLIATGFHRNTMTNTEGGTDDEEFRNAAVVDRVNTTMQVWMGITMACAQCHTHKFDPIVHEEYYQMFAIFNQSSDTDHYDERPTIITAPSEEKKRLAELKEQIAKFQKDIAKETELAKKKTKEEKKTSKKNPALVILNKKLKSAKDEAAKIEKQKTPIMRELAKKDQRETHIHIRGSFLNPGEKVSPQTPEAFGRLPEGQEKDRLALAKWLVAAENPLTARVAVNHHWEEFFGTGLVETSEDFGSQGSLPTHPELLDFLAVEFRESGWSMKQLCKTIVMSAAYRQSSNVSSKKLAKDPYNRLISRGARFRLSAEQIRDNALAASGLLSAKIGGPSVRPFQPKLGLGAAFGSSLDWTTSAGEDRHRRALYTVIRRVSPYPSLVALGATNRITCTIRRVRTNTPVGAFVTLNDPVFIEAAQALARKTLSSDADTVKTRAEYAFRSVLSRSPSSGETASLVRLLESSLEHYKKDLAAAKQMATEPIGPTPKDMDLAELASWTVVCNVVLNLDGALTKD